MKHIPEWPKIRWSIYKDESGLVICGNTMWDKARLAMEQVISDEGIKRIRLPFWVLRRTAMQQIRSLLTSYVDRRSA